MSDRDPALAVLVDYENMARPGAKGRGDFDIELVLSRLSEKGRVLVKRAYADWSRYRDARKALINAGLELIEMPSAREGAKNRADIKMAVDAMELVYARGHLDNFVIVSGDSDFTPLVGKLRELNKRVTGVGNRESASELLIANVDEFIYYDKIASGATRASGDSHNDMIELLRSTLRAIHREGTDLPMASVVKDSMRRKAPAFDESDLGFSTFSKFLEDAADKNIIRIQTDERSGTYRVSLGDGGSEDGDGEAGRGRRGRRGGRGRGRGRSEGGARRRASEDSGDVRRRRQRRAERAERPERPAESDGDDGEVFEIVVSDDGDELEGLPPADTPISYEDMIMMSPEIGAADDRDDDVTPEELSDAEDAPARRRRVRRRATKAADEESTADERAEEEKAEEKKPARRRRTTKKAEEEAAADEKEKAEEKKPARRRRTTKKAEEEAAADEKAEEKKPARRRRTTKKAEEEAAADEKEKAEEKKPARRRRTTKKAEEEAAADETAEEKKPARRRRTTKKAEEEAAADEKEKAEEKKPARRRRTTKKAEEEAAADA